MPSTSWGPGEYSQALAAPRLPAPKVQSGRIRLRTLMLMRWAAVTGQTTTVLIVNFVLQYDFPLAWTLAVIGMSAALNVYFMWRHSIAKRLNDTEAALHLTYDTFQLAVLMFLTGGLHNPFSFLLIAGAVVSATVLRVRTTGLLTGVIVVSATVLAFVHLPLPWPDSAPSPTGIADLPHPWLEGDFLSSPIVHLPFRSPVGEHPISHIYAFGVWSALVVGMIFVSVNVMRLGAESRRLSDALAETQMALAREQRLSDVCGLAAAAAHELGTPLGTIAVVAKELSRELPWDNPHADDVRLLINQSERCREILARLTLHSEVGGNQSLHRLPFITLVEMAAGTRRREQLEVTVEYDPGLAWCDGEGRGKTAQKILPPPIVPQSLEIIHGLENLIENAVDFARSRVVIKGGWSERKVIVEITDDGPGISRDILGSLGEPYVSSRRDAGGLGLGVFIAKTLMERTGAEIEFGNRPEGGARVVVVWPRASFAEDIPSSRGALQARARRSEPV